MFVMFFLFFISTEAQQTKSNFLDQKYQIETQKLESLKNMERRSSTLPNLQGGFATSNAGSREVYLQQTLPWGWIRNFEANQFKTLQEHQQLMITKTQREIEAYKTLLRLNSSILGERSKHLNERVRVLKEVLQQISQMPTQVSSHRVDKFAIESKYRLFLMHQQEILTNYKANQSQLEALELKEFPKVQLNTKVFFNLDEIKSAWKNHINVKLLDQEVTHQEISVKRESMNRLPEVSIGLRNKLDWGSIEENVLQMNFSLPIWDLNNSKLKTERSVLETKKMEREQLDLQNQMDFNQLVAEFEQSKRAVDIYSPELIKKLESDLKNTEALFRRSAINAITFLQLEESGHEQIEMVLSSQLRLLTSYLNLVGPTELPLKIEEIIP